MEQVEIKFKKLSDNAQLPKRNRPSDTGIDVFSAENTWIPARGSCNVETGLSFAYIPKEYWIRIESRSGLGFKHGVQAFPGIIDSSYRGSAAIKLQNHSDTDYEVKIGDRIAQLVLYKNYDVSVEFGEIESSDRGADGFGSSGR